MNFSCETIINENEKLKLTDLDKSCLNIFDYLKLHHHINFLQIDIKKNDDIQNLFLCAETSEDYLINTLEFKQNCDTVIIFHFLSQNQNDFESVKTHLDAIKMSLLIFSQSLFSKYMEKTLNEMSLIDHLTGSYNRCYLDNYAGNLLSISNREQKKIAFIKVGIDQFKAVIDEFDYEVGDKVLKALAKTLKDSVRESDLVIKISDDEFLVILQNIINESNAILISEKLINNFSRKEVIINEQTKQTLMKTICGGISIYPDNATTVEEIIKKSDIALYEARNRGRSQVFMFSEEDTNKIDFFLGNRYMKNKILELIKSSATNEDDYKSLESIFNLHEQLQYATNIKQMAEDIFTWLNKEFNVDNLTFSLFDVNKNYKEVILKKGEEFYLDDDLSYFFIINTHTSLNATVSFCATSKVHFKILETKYNTIEAAFFQVSPIIQSGILKKNFIESSSLDSVTNVYNRNYLIENLTTHLRLSNNTQNEIYFLMIGIDHFKAVIDEFDYDVADKVLIELAKIIHSNINEFDMVGRLNGDEFLVSLINSSNEYQAEELAKKIISDFAEISIIVNEEKNRF